MSSASVDESATTDCKCHWTVSKTGDESREGLGRSLVSAMTSICVNERKRNTLMTECQ